MLIENRTVAHFSYEIGSLWRVGVAYFEGPTHLPFGWIEFRNMCYITFGTTNLPLQTTEKISGWGPQKRPHPPSKDTLFHS